MKNVAIITAGGTGTRLGAKIPKQFLCVKDKPIIVYTIQAFQNHPLIDEIYIACLDEWQPMLQAYVSEYSLSKVVKIVDGGTTNQLSIYNCLREIDEDCMVIIHDGNRPLVGSDIIADALKVASDKGNAVACIPCTEVVLKKNSETSSVEALSRVDLMRTQTPHCFHKKFLIELYERAVSEGVTSAEATCGLAAMYGNTLFFSKGSTMNFKITTIEDLQLFKGVIQCQ